MLERARPGERSYVDRPERRRADVRQGFDRDGMVSHAAPPSSAGKRGQVRVAKAASDCMPGTSTRTPTTVASAAPDCSPKRLIATAAASSKKLDVPISAQGAATLKGTRHAQAAA